MHIPMIGQRIAAELLKPDIKAYGLRHAYYPAPASGSIEGPAAFVFASLGDAPAWGEQIWHHEIRCQLMIPAKVGAQVSEINALERLIMPVWDHFRPGSLASQLRLPDQEGSVSHCYPARYEAGLIVTYAGVEFTATFIYFDVKAHRFAGDE